MTKLKNSYYDKTQNSNCDKPKQKVWQNSKTKIVTKLKNSNSDQTQKLKLWRFFGIKLKKSICDKIQKIKYWQNSKTQIATKKNQIVTKLKNSNCDSSDSSSSDSSISDIF